MSESSRVSKEGRRPKVIIIGGGIAGLTCARCCLDHGLQVELYERRSREGMISGPGGIFIQRNAMRVYELIAKGFIRDELYKKGGRILTGGFCSNQGEPLYVSTPKGMSGEDDLGVCILRPVLQQILLNSLGNDSIVRNGYAFDKYEEKEGGVKVTFKNGESVEGDVLVGADGLKSKTRAALVGREKLESPIFSGTCCWRGYFHSDGIPLPTEFSWAELWGKGEKFGYFDVGGGRYSFYVFDNAEPNGNDEEQGGNMNVLKSLLHDYVEPVPSILKALEDQQQKIYRDDIYDREPPGEVWGKGPVTFMGDAIHPVLPHIGQGGCMAIEDSFELCKRLSQPGLSLETSDGRSKLIQRLRNFEKDRAKRVARVFATSRQVGQLGQANTALKVFIRNWIYKLMPAWLADLQFKWLFDYRPTYSVES